MPAPKKNAKTVVETPAVETPAVETPAVETPAVEQPADATNSDDSDDIDDSTESQFGRIVIGMGSGDVKKAIIDAGGIINKNGVEIPEGFDIMPSLRKFSELSKQPVSEVYKTASKSDQERIDENLKIAFVNNLKIMRFAASMVKVSDVRAALRKTASGRNAGLKKKAQVILASLPADTFIDEFGEELFKIVSGMSILEKRPRGHRGTEANGLAQLGFPQPADQRTYLVPETFGIKIVEKSSGKSSSSVNVGEAMDDFGVFNL